MKIWEHAVVCERVRAMPNVSARVKSLKLTEKQFQAQVVQLAKLRGWLVFHPFDSRKSAAGFPDLVLVRGREIAFVELKTDTGKLTREQEFWLDLLRTAAENGPIVRVGVWRPSDWAEIEGALR